MYTPACPQTHRPLLRFHEALQQGLGVHIAVKIVLALLVCSPLVRVIAHVPNKDAQDMNTTAHALLTIHGHDGPCLLPSVAMRGNSLHGPAGPYAAEDSGALCNCL